jgi:hypothetical protein
VAKQSRLRSILATVQIATVQAHVLSMFNDSENFSDFTPRC